MPLLLPGVLLGEPMSGVPGVDGTPGVEGLPIDEPLLLPGAPRPFTPKCEFTCWLQDESIVGQLLELNAGALCSLPWSTFNVNWFAPLSVTRLHGTATRLPAEVVPMLVPVVVELRVPMPLELVALLVPGAPVALSKLNTTN
jgi:hypothetical protein